MQERLSTALTRRFGRQLHKRACREPSESRPWTERIRHQLSAGTVQVVVIAQTRQDEALCDFAVCQ
ncbi:hypothetical protein PoB_000414900, partial [Plakobranchus ocellatus]